MKKTILIIFTAILFAACNNQAGDEKVEEIPQPYNGIWFRAFETFTFDNDTFYHTYNQETPPLELRGNIEIVDEDTIALKYKEAKGSTGVWAVFSGANLNKTFDWIIERDTMFLTNVVNNIKKDYVKQ